MNKQATDECGAGINEIYTWQFGSGCGMAVTGTSVPRRLQS